MKPRRSRSEVHVLSPPVAAGVEGIAPKAQNPYPTPAASTPTASAHAAASIPSPMRSMAGGRTTATPSPYHNAYSASGGHLRSLDDYLAVRAERPAPLFPRGGIDPVAARLLQRSSGNTSPL